MRRLQRNGEEMKHKLRRLLCMLIGHGRWVDVPGAREHYIQTGEGFIALLHDSRCSRCGIRYGDYWR